MPLSVPLAALLAALAALPADPPSAAAGFAAALAADDPAAFGPLAAEALPRGPAWRSVHELVETHDQIVVRAHRLAEIEETPDGGAILLVEVEGTALTAGLRRPVELPRWWNLEAERLAGRWRVRSALTLERRLAERLGGAAAPALEEAMRGRPQPDPEPFLVELAEVASRPGAAEIQVLAWALAESRARGLGRGESAVLQALSSTALTGDPAAALVHARDALAAAEARGGPGDVAESLFSIGIAQWFGDRVDEAVETLLRSAGMIDAVDDPRTPFKALYMAGYLELRRGRVRESLALHTLYERHLERHPWPRGFLDAAYAAAGLHERLGNTEVVEREQQRAIAAARALGDPAAEAMALYNVAVSDLAAGDPASGIENARRALELAVGRLEPGIVALFHAALGEGQLVLGDLPAAEAALGRAIEMAASVDERGTLATAHELMSALRVRQGRADEALAHAREARRFVLAPEGLTRAVAIESPWRPLAAEGRALRAAGRPAAAEAAWREAIAVIESERSGLDAADFGSAAAFARKLAPYRELLVLLVDQGRTREALEVAERMRARSLREALERGQADLSAGLTAAERRREEELEGRLVELNRAVLSAGDGEAAAPLARERDEARLALQRWRAETYLAHPEVRRRRPLAAGERGALDGAAVPDGGLVLDFVVGEEETLAFAVSPGSPERPAVEVRRLPVGAARLGAMVEGLLTSLRRRDPAFAPAAGALHDVLLAPFAHRLAGVTTLVVVPDGVLWKLPFQVLRDRSGNPLVERMAVWRAPSLSALARGRGAAGAGGDRLSLLALGDPTAAAAAVERVRAFERGPALGALPEAADEVRALGALYGRERSTVLVGEAARERLLKERAGDYDVIHLATHGLLDDRAPLFSALLLAAPAGDGEDGLLEVREIAELRLRARLVVLSACETAGGRLEAGEGVLGMAWALLAAGVPAAVVSDWKTDSAATAALMVELHRRLLTGEGTAEALRRAQLALRRDPRTAHPYYWAPFAVVATSW